MRSVLCHKSKTIPRKITQSSTSVIISYSQKSSCIAFNRIVFNFSLEWKKNKLYMKLKVAYNTINMDAAMFMASSSVLLMV